MPKKTKKQKLLAELHRKMAVADIHSVIQPQSHISKKNDETRFPRRNSSSISISLTDTSVKSQLTTDKTSYSIRDSFSGTSNIQTIPKPKSSSLMTDYSYVRHDLIKITIFTVFAFLLQGVLYFLLHRA
ncbi:hypothetical protein M1271_02810 [Patescibacteria group bacterium]|nr:hypothetical protein [Patescibacteria group bacterium]MCL5798176.1 hypothetical protein [Patescibacteria group bacterium]